MTHENVVTYTQFLSAELIEGIVYGGADAGADPRWAESGAVSREEYATWCGHCCGMACLQMVLHHRDGRTPPLLELMRGCRSYGGYVERPDGEIKGLYYAPFAEYVGERHGLVAEVRPELTVAEIAGLLGAGRLVMASVHREIRRPERAAPGRGGHLVLITGCDGETISFRNPSGHSASSRAAVLPQATFAAFFAGRGISLALS
ncbi:C39 family peptidase [Rhizohabitans arisaemae]|uniref:C39 family peptidase n=1 Tax=Rhizohabitans arisaemae TaxID=2720610 RepID=UPI0024B23864|nr:C39 family peptidase [Rhizohabitans arisaemae]